MRRPAALLLAVALLASMAAPAAAGDLEVEPATSAAPEVGPSVEPSVEPLPSPVPDPSAVDPSASVAPEATPPPDATPAPAAVDSPAATVNGADPAGRWIVIYKNGTNVAQVAKGQASRIGFRTERTFNHALRGFSAALSARQVRLLRSDPSVAAVVPDEKIELQAQSYPTGISRVGALTSVSADIDGADDRVDADVAIVDTGIRTLAELNVAGGYNCSTTDRTAWRDVHGHGTHVAGTVGAIDNDQGVVGVAPGVRLWAVKILNDSGEGLLSWYVCGLDWIAAQRDPDNSSRPMFESVNMSVAKWGKDDAACGTLNADILHAAICRLVASGVTVVAAAANDSGSAAARVPAAYNEVITVSALADTDGKPGGLGGNRCYSWGSYDSDDTFANFSNFGSDIDLIAPGKCIWSTVPSGYQYMSGTSMAAPHVAGAAALLKETRPQLTPAEVKEALQYLGTLDWKTTSDPDSTHERLLNVSRLGPRGAFSVAIGASSPTAEAGGTATIPISLTRSATSFERIRLSATGLPSGFSVSFSPSSVYGFTGLSTSMLVTVPSTTASGTYSFTVVADEHGVVDRATATVRITKDNPTAGLPSVDAYPTTVIGTSTVRARVYWSPATDPSSAIAGYEVQMSVDGGAWSAATGFGSATRVIGTTQTFGHAYAYRLRARDAVGNWSAWVQGATVRPGLTQDSSSAITYRGTWYRQLYTYASGGSVRYTTATSASATFAFSGRAIALVAPAGPTRGSARIYVDGVYRATVNFRASAGQSRKVMYSTAVPNGSHTIEVRAVGNGRIDLDAFVVFR